MIIPSIVFRLLVIASLAIGLSGCATNYISASRAENPPPTEKFSSFQSFEVKPLALAPEYQGQKANEAALNKIQENFDLRVNQLLEEWNAASPGDGGRTLVITPLIQDIKFINASSRVWGGAMAGSSAVLLRLSITDKETGEVIADPEFFQRAAAMGGAWSFGATDNNMLIRITEISSEYLRSNYDVAVGGPTGAQNK